MTIKTEFVEQKGETDRSTFYNSNGHFQRLHANVANLEFLGNSAVDFKYCLLFIVLFFSKVHTYAMKSRRLIAKKMNEFYQKVNEKKRRYKNETAD